MSNNFLMGRLSVGKIVKQSARCNVHVPMERFSFKTQYSRRAGLFSVRLLFKADMHLLDDVPSQSLTDRVKLSRWSPRAAAKTKTLWCVCWKLVSQQHMTKENLLCHCVFLQAGRRAAAVEQVKVFPCFDKGTKQGDFTNMSQSITYF